MASPSSVTTRHNPSKLGFCFRWHEFLAQLRQLLEDSITKERQLLEEHRALQLRILEKHEVKLEKILSRGEGVWFSDFWMKFLCVFLLVYTVVTALLAYFRK
ncbi:MAG: hypothetical protein ACI4A7_05610 [Prevotella sp.]